jgi:hypothetical protein
MINLLYFLFLVPLKILRIKNLRNGYTPRPIFFAYYQGIYFTVFLALLFFDFGYHNRFPLLGAVPLLVLALGLFFAIKDFNRTQRIVFSSPSTKNKH